MKIFLLRVKFLRSYLILAIILGTSPCAASSYDHTYTVAPNNSMCINATNSCQVFRKYLINAKIYFQSQTEFIFLPGVHLFDLGYLLEVHDKLNLHLVGSSNFKEHSLAENVKQYGLDPYNDDQYITYLQSTTVILCTNRSGLMFSNITNLTLSNLTLLNCGQYSFLTSQIASIHISNIYNLLIEGVSVLNSTGYGLFGANIFGQSQITSSSFVGNNQYVKYLLQPVPIRNCKNEIGHLYTFNESFDNSNYTGGNVLLYFDDSSLIQNDQLRISFILVALGMDAYFNDMYHHTLGTGLSIELNQSLYGMTIIIDNLVAYRNQGTDGANIYIDVTNSTSHTLLTNVMSSYATAGGSGVHYSVSAQYYVSSYLFSCRGCMFECSINYKYSYSVFMYLKILSTNHLDSYMQNVSEFGNCTFIEDGSAAGSSISIISNLKAIHVNRFLYITDSTFINVYFTMDGIHCFIMNSLFKNTTTFFTSVMLHLRHISFLQSTINVYGTTTVQLEGYNTFVGSRMVFYSGIVTLAGKNTFSNNFLFAFGGAIILQSTHLLFASNSIATFTNNTALYGGAIYIDSSSNIEFGSLTNVSFINNTAFLTGGAIYAEPQDVCFYTLNCTDLEGIHLYFEGNYANDAGSVLYGGNIDTCKLNTSCMYNSTFVIDYIVVIGYHDSSTSLISSDAQCISSCNTTTTPVCLKHQCASVYPGQTLELTFATVGQRNGIVPTVIYIYSNTNLFGTIRTLKQCSSYSIPYEFNNGTQVLIAETALLSDNSLSVSITVLPCPILFKQHDLHLSCICDPLLERHNLVCNIEDVRVQNTGNIWIGLTLQGVPAFYSQCPFDYCTQNKTINVLELDSQCSYRRSGVLCGRCQGNLSMTFGTSQCASCSNHFLLLIIVFIIMGVLLVVVVIISNFTVSNGALNVIVLYVNLIRINYTIFFQSRSAYSSILSIFIAWLNLDLGIEVCFYNGMDSYAKTWLQFVFPISLIGAILVAGRYATSISKLFRFNAVPVLSTLVLLSYSKILRTIITIFSFASLDTISSLSTGSLVWQYDGNVEYLGREHLPLFICGLFITLVFIFPYSTLLLLAPCTQVRSHWRCLQWVNNLKPFLDSYQAPFKDRYRFWPGIYLFIRLPMYLVFILSDSTPVKMFTIIFCAILYLCSTNVFSVYKNWSDLLVESIFIANIVVLSAAALVYRDIESPISSEAIIIIGITSAMLLLAVIVIHHRLRKIQSCMQFWRSVSTINSGETAPLQIPVASYSDRSSSSEYREPLLENN